MFRWFFTTFSQAILAAFWLHFYNSFWWFRFVCFLNTFSHFVDAFWLHFHILLMLFDCILTIVFDALVLKNFWINFHDTFWNFIELFDYCFTIYFVVFWLTYHDIVLFCLTSVSLFLFWILTIPPNLSFFLIKVCQFPNDQILFFSNSQTI